MSEPREEVGVSQKEIIKCSTCGASLKETLFYALLKDYGARVNDPSYCPAAKNHEHTWAEKANEEKK